jgi:hypothetical protein
VTLATTRTAIASAITAGCTGWRALDYVPSQINPPQMIVDFEVNPQITFGDMSTAKREHPLIIQAFVPRDSDRASQLKLDVLRDPTDATSLWQVLAASAVGDYAQVTHCGACEVTTVAGVEYLMLTFQGDVIL